jgi:4-hydroxybenzoyl-CoA thioesterase/acyl-CoA thioester hydrolase
MGSEFTMKRMVQFAETDLAGVMHFSNYYRIMEELEHAFWRSLDQSVVMRVGGGAGSISWPRVATSCEYSEPARFEDVLDLSLTVAKVGDRSVTYEVAFHRDGRRIAFGKMTAVCTIMHHGRFERAAIPDDIRDRLEAYSSAV